MACKYKFEDKTYTTATGAVNQYKKRRKEEYAITESKLKSIINGFGISITSMDDYINRYGNPFKNKVAALSDLARNIIAVGENGKESISEEFAHIIVGNYRDSVSYKKAMDSIKSTKIYKEKYKEYADLYNNDITKIKEEMLGKIMSDIIIKQIVTPKGYNTAVLHLNRVLQKFLSLFTKDKTNYIKSELDFLAKNVLIDKADLVPVFVPYSNPIVSITLEDIILYYQDPITNKFDKLKVDKAVEAIQELSTKDKSQSSEEAGAIGEARLIRQSDLDRILGRKTNNNKEIFASTDEDIDILNKENQINNLDKKLQSYLESFGVTFKDIKELNINVDALGVTDLMSKIIYLSENRKSDTLTEEASHIIMFMLGQDNVHVKELMNNIELWSKYKSIYNEYYDAYNGNIEKIKFEAAGKLLTERILKQDKYDNSGILQKIILDIIDAISKLINSKKIPAVLRLNSAQLASKILKMEQGLIPIHDISGREQIDVDSAFKDNPYESEIIEKITKLKGYVTGSTAISIEGKILRPKENPFHDIDFSFETKKDIVQAVKFLKQRYGAVYTHAGIQSKDKKAYAYAVTIPKEGWELVYRGLIPNKEIRASNRVKGGWQKGKLKANNTFFRRKSDGKIFRYHEDNALNIDLFYNGKERDDGTFIKASVVFKQKQRMNKSSDIFFRREKDLKDFNGFSYFKSPDTVLQNQYLMFQLNEKNKIKDIGFVTETPSFTQEEVEEKFKVKTLEQLIKQLSSRASRLSGTQRKAETRERLKIAIDLLKSNVERVQYDTAITEFAKHTSEEIVRVIEAIDGKQLSKYSIQALKDFLGIYQPYVKFLETNVNENSKELIQPIITGMLVIEDKFYKETERLAYSNTLTVAKEVHGTDEEGLKKTGLDLSVFKEFRTTLGHYFNYLLGNTSHSTEPIAQLVYDIVTRVIVNVRITAKDRHKKYAERLEKLGVLGKNTKSLFTKASVSSDTKKIQKELTELKGVLKSLKGGGTKTTQVEELIKEKLIELEESKKTSIAKFISRYDTDKFNQISTEFWDAHKAKYGYVNYKTESELRKNNKGVNKQFFKEVKDFYATHTEQADDVFIKEVFEVYGKSADVSPLVINGIWTKEQWEDWHDTNSRVYAGERVYDRGIFSRPKLSLYGDAQYEKLTDNEKEALEILKSWKRDIDLKYNREPNDNVPAVIQSLLDIAYYEREGMTDKLSSQFKESFQKGIEDEATFGSEYNTVANDKFYDDAKIPTIPILYTNPIKHEDVTTDIIGAMMMYDESAENFVQMSKELPTLSLILDGLRRSTGFKKNIFTTGRKVGKDTALYKGLQTFIAMNVLGQHKEAFTVGNTNVTKIVDGVVNYTRNKNLGWNVWSAFSGLMSASVGTVMHSMVGRYFSKEDATFGMTELGKNMSDIVSQRGRINNKNKLMVLIEEAGLADEAALYRNIDKGQITKNTASSVIYGAFQAAGYPTRAIITAGIFNNVRLINGKWMSEFNYTNTYGENKEIWDKATTMYSQISVNELGQSSLSNILPRADYIKTLRRIETISNELEGSLTNTEKGKIHQSPLGSVVGMHRGFFFNNLFKAFKGNAYNSTLDGYDVGNHRQLYETAAATILNAFSVETIQSWEVKLSLWNELKPYQRKALQLAMYQNTAVVVFAVVGYALMKIGEDEDDPVLDHVMYLADKTLLEMSSIAPFPFGAFTGEILDTVDSPLLPLKILRQQANIMDLIFGWNEQVERGAWKDQTKGQKALFQMIPIASQWGKLVNPDQSSQYLRMNKLSWYYNTPDYLFGETK